YPYGDSNAATRSVISGCGYNSARSIGGVVGPTTCFGCPFAESIPPANLWSTQTPDSIKTTTSLATLQDYVTQAEDHGGGWVQLVMHHVCDGCTGTYAISPSMLSAFLDWLAQRGSQGTVVKTVNQVIGGPLRAGVP